MDERLSLPMFLNCFIGCPYQLQCGVAVQNNFLSCIDQIHSVIPDVGKIEAKPLDKVKVFNSKENLIAVIERGAITEVNSQS